MGWVAVGWTKRNPGERRGGASTGGVNHRWIAKRVAGSKCVSGELEGCQRSIKGRESNAIL